MSRPLPSAEQVAAIILAAARECGENPQDIVDGKAGSRARIYAYVALRERCGGLTIKDAGRLCFAPNIDGLKAYAVQAVQRDWWDGAVLARISTTPPVPPTPVVLAAPVKAGPALRQTRSPPLPASRDDHGTRSTSATVAVIRHAKPAPALCLNPLVRRAPPARSSINVTAEFAGDPPPGRSALDEKLRRERASEGTAS